MEWIKLAIPAGKPVFSVVVVISDRRVIDRQLQRTLTQVIETNGMLVNLTADRVSLLTRPYADSRPATPLK